jgi:hypothetical protein
VSLTTAQHELEIQISHQTGAQYRVTADAPHVPSGAAQMTIDPDEPTFKGDLEEIDKDGAAADIFERMGARLFERAIADKVRDAYVAALTGRSAASPLTVSLQIAQDAAKLYRLPWTLLFRAAEGHIACTENTPLIYRIEQLGAHAGRRSIPPVHEHPLRILIVPANPRPFDPSARLRTINPGPEIAKIREALAPLGKKVVFDYIRPGSNYAAGQREALKHTLQSYKPHVVHFICHGPQNRVLAFEKPSLLLEDHQGVADLYHWDLLRVLLANDQDLRLVILNACNSDGVAWRLAESGIPAIGMRYDVFAQEAETFAEETYQALVSGSTVGIAVNRARRAIRNFQENSHAWFAPALFLPSAVPDFKLIELGDLPPPPPPPPPAKVIVTVRSLPSGASVLVDDVERAVTPAEIAVPPGSYRFDVRKKRIFYVPRRRQVTVKGDTVRRLRFFGLHTWALPPVILIPMLVWGIAASWERLFGVPAGMVLIPAGDYTVGTPGTDTPLLNIVRPYRLANLDLLIESPPERAIGEAFAIDRYEVTN